MHVFIRGCVRDYVFARTTQSKGFMKRKKRKEKKSQTNNVITHVTALFSSSFAFCCKQPCTILEITYV